MVMLNESAYQAAVLVRLAGVRPHGSYPRSARSVREFVSRRSRGSPFQRPAAWTAHWDRRFGRGQIRAPDPLRVGLDLVVGAPAQYGSGVILGVPALNCVLIVLMHQQPLVRSVPDLSCLVQAHGCHS